MWLSKMILVGMFATIMLWMGDAGNAIAAPETLVVFAAASTTNAVIEIGEIFTQSGQERFIPSFASSSTLAKQIENGAPADIYISANMMWMNHLEEKRMIEKGTRIDLLRNRIVLIVPADHSVSQLLIAPGFDLPGLIGDGYLSMGDPDHVPAGIYGKKALENLGVWAAIENHVARSKDVRAALSLVERGEVPVGLVYATDAAISQRVKIVGIFPESSHPPVIYPAAVVAGKRSRATDRFMELLQSSEAKAVFEKFGFSVR